MPALATVQESLAYLEKRRAMLNYARFQAHGYPVGSGSVESAKKLAVESRLKRAGMHWARTSSRRMIAESAYAGYNKIAENVRR